MRLNPECVRMILMICEQNLNNHNIVRFGMDFDTYNNLFDGNELQYTAKNLSKVNFLKVAQSVMFKLKSMKSLGKDTNFWIIFVMILFGNL